ncbi:nucleotidyltransferase domain-containing protein [Solihabitans fulvus]|uniref:Nucleotidyltransferase domain-containing protein n=1 Tax=Solihabitans fulvus TaxID=1892852 RepID=A0A5B2XSE5_9PSEU|nr:nucleotidyltransferase domain-containing protein [Solihabitans fulvus]KAA2266617.1 nucleotidyltransferase domain-containing protein [Solihabitans fulvus]
MNAHWFDSTATSTGRRREVEELLQRVAQWAEKRKDVVGVLLVGSWARQAAREDSDVDLLLLTEEPRRYDAASLAEELSLGAFVVNRTWGPVTEWRFVTGSGLEIEVCVGTPSWADTSPVDPGTRRVVCDGVRPVYDRNELFAALVAACAQDQ